MTPERFKQYEAAAPNGFKVLQQGEVIPDSRDCEILRSYHEEIDFREHITDGGQIFDMNRHVIIAYRPRGHKQTEW